MAVAKGKVRRFVTLSEADYSRYRILAMRHGGFSRWAWVACEEKALRQLAGLPDDPESPKEKR